MKKTSIKLITLLVLVTMSLTSCLNDLEDFLGDFSSSPAVVEFNEAPNAATGTTFIYVTYAPGQVDASIVRVNIASANVLGTDSKVTLAFDDAMVTKYNTDHALTGVNAFVPVPAAAITAASMEVTIPAGEREANLDIKMTPSLIPNFFTTKYMVGVKIASVSTGLVISGNNGERYVQVLGKNKYHGSYNSVGWFEHPTASRGLNANKNLLSISANAVTTGYADLGGSGYTYISMTIDEASNLVIPGRTERCYKVNMTFAPASATWYVYDFAAAFDKNGVVEPARDHNYCYQNAAGKWVFELYTGYNGTRKAHETMTQN